MSKINIDSKGSLARLMATENLTVQHKKVSTASFDVKNRVLSLPIWNDMSDVMYDGLIGHEVGHALYTPFEEWKEFVVENPNLKDYANVIEDARIERLMKTKFPGMKKVFFGMYDELNMKDFFGIGADDVQTYGILDRINLYFKLGVRVDVEFTAEEMVFVDRASTTKTFKDVLDLTLDLAEYAKNEDLNTDFDDIGDYELSDEEGEGEEFEFGNDSASSNTSQERGENSKSAGDGKIDDSDDEDGEGEDAHGDGAGGDNDEAPASKTQKNFDDRMGDMNDENASSPIYVDLPNVNVKGVTLGYKKTLEVLTKQFDDKTAYSGYFNDYDNHDERKSVLDKEIRAWKKDTLPVVNYMVKEFEMKQAATAHRRTSVGKTGVLDTNKMHAYRYEEDIFKRVATVKDGKNHALAMYVDWSGSMSDKLLSTVKQTITLVMFARKVGIPFRVYAFTNASGLNQYLGEDNKFYEDNARDNFTKNHLSLERLSLVEFFNEKMNAREFQKGIDNFYKVGVAAGWGSSHYLQCPEGFNLGSTPLNEAIIASYEQISDFKRQTGKEKVNVIFLTDGGSNGNDQYYSVDETWTKSGTRTWGSDKHHMVIRDPKTKKYIATSADYLEMTADLLKGLGQRCDVNVIGFFLTDSRHIKYTIEREMKWQDGVNAKKKLAKLGYVALKSNGYDKYFMINDKSLDKVVEMPEEVAKKDDGSVNKARLSTAFKKFSKGRKLNKMLLNEFVAMVA